MYWCNPKTEKHFVDIRFILHMTTQSPKVSCNIRVCRKIRQNNLFLHLVRGEVTTTDVFRFGPPHSVHSSHCQQYRADLPSQSWSWRYFSVFAVPWHHEPADRQSNKYHPGCRSFWKHLHGEFAWVHMPDDRPGDGSKKKRKKKTLFLCICMGYVSPVKVKWMPRNIQEQCAVHKFLNWEIEGHVNFRSLTLVSVTG